MTRTSSTSRLSSRQPVISLLAIRLSTGLGLVLMKTPTRRSEFVGLAFILILTRVLFGVGHLA